MATARPTPTRVKTHIERAIEQLYAAGLELEGDRHHDHVPGRLPECVRRIDALMADLRAVAAIRPPAAHA